ETAKEYVPKRLLSRYFPDDEETEAEPEESEETSEPSAPAHGATPISRAAETLTGYVTVTAKVATTQTLGEDGCKAILKDETGAMDLVAWEADVASRLQELEGEYVVVHDAEVREYEGKRQLTFVESLTELGTIQQGVGYTGRADPGQNTELGATADGGVVEPDSEDETPRVEGGSTGEQNEETPQEEAVQTMLAAVEMNALSNGDNTGAPRSDV
ncbi:hypothetical protein C5B86_19725, partial [Haloferax sp. Atlit-19N]|uniref:hypothetical protein n=1 Tax=Haloferax sp. Atlit-19N TaxID=2077201 RepID=UPI000E3AEF9E